MDSSVLTLTGLSILIPFLTLVSITPGMCMTLALTLSISIGFKKTLMMMAGELLGVAAVVVCVVYGVAGIMLANESLFMAFKVCGGIYLIYLGIQLFYSKGKMQINLDSVAQNNLSFKKLSIQGFMTAFFNPKGWAFSVALLPSFINYQSSIELQLFILLLIVVPIEFMSLCIYASGGSYLRKVLHQSGKIKFVNRISGFLMSVVGIWLMVS